MKFEVWNEGYACTGNSGTAQFLGTEEADSFQEACKKALIRNGWNMSYYDEENNRYWGCWFFDNEVDARKSFG
jgi:hypothetical protein